MTSATSQPPEVLDLLIVGGGLSGVLLAHEVHQKTPTIKWALVEARSLLGGRLANDKQGRLIDLGGAWVWPEHQPNMKNLLKNLSVKTFRQPDDPSSTRIDGGAVEIVNQLAKDLPKDQIYLDSPVKICKLLSESETQQQCSRTNEDGIRFIQVDTVGRKSFLAKTVVMAAPPKLVSKHIEFTPALSTEKQSAMNNSHTWMAGVTKVSLVYPKPFWEKDMSNMGLPGGGSGPAFQMYDASTIDGSIKALTFFALVPPHSPAIHDDTKLTDQIVGQLAMVWNHYGRKEMAQQLKSYTEVHVHRWPHETYISEDDKPTSIHPHPHPVSMLSKPEWDGQLLFAGSETDLRSPGVMEGAVGAAQRVCSQLRSQVLQATR